jgi:hypothetical protein
MLVSQEHYEIGSSALRPAAFRAAFSLEHHMTNIVVLKAVDAHCWANMHMRAERIPAFSMAWRCGSALSRVIRVSPRALSRWSSSLCRAVHRGGFRARRNDLNCGIVETLMSGGGIGAIFLAFPIPLGSTNVLFNAPNAAAFGRLPPKCPVAAEPANEAAGEAKTTKNAKATFTEVLDMGEAPL